MNLIIRILNKFCIHSIMGLVKVQQRHEKYLRVLMIWVAVLLFQTPALAYKWKFFPNLRVAETFSDNINLDPSGSEQSAFVTEISPSISINRAVGRNRLNLDYRLQGLYNAGGDSAFTINHQLQFNSRTVLRRNSLFLNLRSTISQQNISNVRASNDNITGSANRTNVYTYGVSPTWTPRFNGYANGVFNFDFDAVDFSGGQASDTKTYRGTASLSSGWRFSRVRWFLNYQNTQQDRSDGDNVKLQNASGELRVNLNRYFSLSGRAGYSDNQFQATTNNNQNGISYSFGARWAPSRRFIISAGYGNNSFVTLSLVPTRNMSWVTTYQHNEIGTNTGNVWRTLFRYNTKRSVWSAAYFEDTTTTQTVLSELTIIDGINPITQQPGQFLISLPTLTNEVFIRKRADLNYGFRTGKSTININLFGEKREFQVQQNNEEVYGVNGTWNWRFIRRSSFFIRSSWQHTNREAGIQGNPGNSNDDRFDVRLVVDRQIPLKIGKRNQMSASLEYRYLNQISTIAINEFEENRITASILLRF